MCLFTLVISYQLRIILCVLWEYQCLEWNILFQCWLILAELMISGTYLYIAMFSLILGYENENLGECFSICHPVFTHKLCLASFSLQLMTYKNDDVSAFLVMNELLIFELLLEDFSLSRKTRTLHLNLIHSGNWSYFFFLDSFPPIIKPADTSSKDGRKT